MVHFGGGDHPPKPCSPMSPMKMTAATSLPPAPIVPATPLPLPQMRVQTTQTGDLDDPMEDLKEELSELVDKVIENLDARITSLLDNFHKDLIQMSNSQLGAQMEVDGSLSLDDTQNDEFDEDGGGADGNNIGEGSQQSSDGFDESRSYMDGSDLSFVP